MSRLSHREQLVCHRDHFAEHVPVLVGVPDLISTNREANGDFAQVIRAKRASVDEFLNDRSKKPPLRLVGKCHSESPFAAEDITSPTQERAA